MTPSHTDGLSALQTAASGLGPGVTESACKPSNSCFSVCSPLGLWKQPHWFSRQMLGGLASQRQVLRAGSLVWGTNPSLLGENLWVWGPSCWWVAGPMVRFMARQPQSILLASQWAFASVLTQTSCSAGVQVLFGGDCSVSGCGFGVSSEESSSESSCVAILEAHSTLFSFSSFSCFLPDQLIFKKWLSLIPFVDLLAGILYIVLIVTLGVIVCIFIVNYFKVIIFYCTNSKINLYHTDTVHSFPSWPMCSDCYKIFFYVYDQAQSVLLYDWNMWQKF